MSNTTHKKPPVSDGAGSGADSLRILNRTAVNSIIKECFVEMGAAQYATAIPFAEELIRSELAPKAEKLEALVKKLITSEIFQQAVARHAAHVAQQKKNKNRQPELFAGNEEHAS